MVYFSDTLVKWTSLNLVRKFTSIVSVCRKHEILGVSSSLWEAKESRVLTTSFLQKHSKFNSWKQGIRFGSNCHSTAWPQITYATWRDVCKHISSFSLKLLANPVPFSEDYVIQCVLLGQQEHQSTIHNLWMLASCYIATKVLPNHQVNSKPFIYIWALWGTMS